MLTFWVCFFGQLWRLFWWSKSAKKAGLKLNVFLNPLPPHPGAQMLPKQKIKERVEKGKAAENICSKRKGGIMAEGGPRLTWWLTFIRGRKVLVL